MSDAALGLSMLGLIVVVIMLGFPTAFTLMGLGMFFGFIAFYDPSQHWLDNKIFDLMVQRAFGAMNNETLLSIPLFVLMGYVMERGAWSTACSKRAARVPPRARLARGRRRS
jgi:TRAP-type mannitol/chloroaromatic compound transport system permease large subunit